MKTGIKNEMAPVDSKPTFAQAQEAKHHAGGLSNDSGDFLALRFMVSAMIAVFFVEGE